MDTNEAAEAAINQTYPGLTLLFRDANLGSLISEYRKNMIIREKGFIDASKRGGGICTDSRFAILSNSFMDASEYEHGTNWGLCIMARDSHFKVLDVYAKEGKTQVTLLHLPEKQWQLFKNICTNLDEQVVSYARKRFDECLSLPATSELATPQWLERCAFPLGMSDEGIMFPLDD